MTNGKSRQSLSINLNGHAEKFQRHELDLEEIELLLKLWSKKLSEKGGHRGKRFWR